MKNNTVILAVAILCFTLSSYAAVPHVGPLISGTSSYVDGKWVWTDYAYDDRGVDSDVTAGGDAQYPEGLRNAADLIQIQVGLLPEGVELTALLQTLTDVSVPEIAFVIDSDADKSTGAAGLPGGAWQPNQPLGAEWFVVASSSGVKVLRWNGTGWEDHAVLPVSINAGTNIVSVMLPRAIVDPGTAQWRIFSMAGLASDSILSGGSVYDLAFVVAELVTDRNIMIADSALGAFITGGTTIWQDERQSAILAGGGNSDTAAATIDFGRIAAGDIDLASAAERGWYTFLHRSSLVLDEGVEQGASALGVGNAFTTRSYLGAYQPYLVLHRGAVGEASHPLVVFLHGASQTHLQNTYWFEPAEANNTFSYPAITIFPLARGEVLYYNDISEVDVLEVMSDAMTRLPVDPERVVLTGFSMGGMGTYKLASLYPDRFSTAVAHFGNASSNGVSTLMENLLNLPFRADNGMIDYLVQASSFLPDRERGIELGYDFRFFDVSNAHHALQPHLANCLLVNAIGRKRVRNPAKLVYAVEANRIMDDPDTGLHLTYDGAYWLSGMALRGGTDYGVVRAISLARADRNTNSKLTDEYFSSDKQDYCGARADNTLSPAAGFHWRDRSIVHTPSAPSPVSNGMELELEAVGALTLDMKRMSLASDKPLQLKVKGDGLSTITLLGDWEGLYELTKDGEKHSSYMSDEAGALVIEEDFSDTHTYVIRLAAGPDEEPEVPEEPEEPATLPEVVPEQPVAQPSADAEQTAPLQRRRSGGGAFSPLTLLALGSMLIFSRRRKKSLLVGK